MFSAYGAVILILAAIPVFFLIGVLFMIAAVSVSILRKQTALAWFMISPLLSVAFIAVSFAVSDQGPEAAVGWVGWIFLMIQAALLVQQYAIFRTMRLGAALASASGFCFAISAAIVSFGALIGSWWW